MIRSGYFFLKSEGSCRRAGKSFFPSELVWCEAKLVLNESGIRFAAMNFSSDSVQYAHLRKGPGRV